MLLISPREYNHINKQNYNFFIVMHMYNVYIELYTCIASEKQSIL